MFRSIFLKTLRDQRWPTLIWSALVMLILLSGYAAFGQVDAGQIAALLRNPALRFFGDPVAVDTAAGFVTFRYGSFFAIALGIFAVLAGSRLLRGEEARGSLDLLLATPRSRAALLREKTLAVVVILLALGLAFAIGALVGEAGQGGPIGAGGALMAGLNLGLLLFFYAMLALFVSQFTRAPGAAAGIAGGLFAFFFMLDATARIYPKAAWVRYLTPNAYYGRSKPLIPDYGANFGAMALLGALGLLLLAGSAALFAGRDIGGVARLPFIGVRRAALDTAPEQQIARAAHDPWLWSVFWRALRATGPALGGWAFGAFLYAAYGTGIVTSSEEQLRIALAGSPALTRLFGENRLATDNGFLSVTVFVTITIVALLHALLRAADWPADQDNGRLDIVLSAPQPRWRVALQSYGAALVGFVLLALAVAVGIVLGAAVTRLPLDTGRVFAAALALVPPMTVIAGAVYALGARLRAGITTGIVGAYLGVAFFSDLLRSFLRLPSWAQRLSIFTAYGTPIVDGINWTASIALLALAVVFVGIGVSLFQTGDMRQGG